MSSFKEFLLQDQSDNFSEIAKLIKRDCQPFLSAAKGNLFYRGMSILFADEYCKPIFNSDSELICTVRNDREPKDSPQWLHRALNNYFVKKVGIPVRSACLFATGSRSTASVYGKVYAIFPIGPMHFAWSSYFADPTQELFISVASRDCASGKLSLGEDKLHDDFMAQLKQDDPDLYDECRGDFEKWCRQQTDDIGDADSSWASFVTKFLQKNDLWTFDARLVHAAMSYPEHEVMFVCDKYYAVHTGHMPKNFREMLK